SCHTGLAARFVIDLCFRVSHLATGSRRRLVGVPSQTELRLSSFIAYAITARGLTESGRCPIPGAVGCEVVMSDVAGDRAQRTTPLGLGRLGLLPNLYDIVIFFLIAAAFVALAHGAREMDAPLARLDIAPVVLDPANLPEYALRTTLRM